MLEKFKTWLEQKKCPHYQQVTSWEVGDRCITSRTVCCACGVAVDPYDRHAVQKESFRLLEEYFG